MTTVAGVGFSNHEDARQAGAEAAAQALAKLDGAADLVIAFTTDRYDQAEAVAGIRAEIGAATLIGCCAGGVITAEQLSAEALTVMAVRSDGLKLHLAMEEGIQQNAVEVGETVARALGEYLDDVDLGERHVAAMVMADGLTGALTEVVQSLADELGPLCPLVGGGAGDNLKFLKTVQFINDDIRSDALAAALLDAEAPLGIGVGHGWKPAGNPLVVTRAVGNIVYEIDGRPAFDIYKEVWAEAAPDLSAETFGAFAMGHPIGMPLGAGEYLIRDPLQVQEDGSIVFVATVPENAVVHMMHGDLDDLYAAARDAAQQALDALEGQPPAAIIVFNCISRLLIMGEQAMVEVEHIRDVVGPDVPLIGMFSFGEIAPPAESGLAVLHNKTVVLCALA